MAKAENPFERQLAAHTELTQETPVAHDVLLDSLDDLEVKGAAQIGAQTLAIAAFGETMRDIYADAVKLTIEPPLTETEANEIQGKILTHTALAQTGINAAATTPTNTANAKTSGRKF